MLLTNEGGLNTGKPRKQETLIRNLANIFFCCTGPTLPVFNVNQVL